MYIARDSIKVVGGNPKDITGLEHVIYRGGLLCALLF
jgi:hypothetical protein